MLGELAWACAHDPGEIDDLARDEPGVIERAHPQGNVDVLADEIDHTISSRVPDLEPKSRLGELALSSQWQADPDRCQRFRQR
jgi:hypothetical protein